MHGARVCECAQACVGMHRCARCTGVWVCMAVHGAQLCERAQVCEYSQACVGMHGCAWCTGVHGCAQAWMVHEWVSMHRCVSVQGFTQCLSVQGCSWACTGVHGSVALMCVQGQGLPPPVWTLELPFRGLGFCRHLLGLTF